MVELRRLNRQRDEHALHPRREDDATGGRDGRAAVEPPTHWRQGSGAVLPTA
jgi:hypothetical protein